jgi:phage terminase large subunit
MNLEINSTITLENAWECNTRIQHHCGATRSGKSYALVQYLIVIALNERKDISIIRKTLPSLKKSAMKDFIEIMQGLNIWQDIRWNATDRIYEFDNGSTIEFFSVDISDKVRGSRRQILWVDEAQELSEDDAFQLGIRTTEKIIYSYNPSFGPTHWLYKNRTEDDVTLFHTTYKNNPYLSKDQVKAIEVLQNRSEKYYRIYGLGEFAGNDKQIFQFDTCEADDIDENELLCYSIDYGFVNDETAVIKLYRRGDKLYIKEMLYEKGLTTNDIADKLNRMGIGKIEIFADSAEPRLNEELYRMGFNIKAVKKGPDSISFGIKQMMNWDLIATKDSTNLINELYSYEWQTDKEGNTIDKPIDAFNHLIDALRYAVMMKLTQKQINAGKYAISVR